MEAAWYRRRRDPDFPAALEAISESLAAIKLTLEKILTEQQSIDRATAALTALTTDVAANVAQLVNSDIPAIQAALAALPAGVDTTALDAAVAAAQGTASSLDSSVSSVTALTPPAAPSVPPQAPAPGTGN